MWRQVKTSHDTYTREGWNRGCCIRRHMSDDHNSFGGCVGALALGYHHNRDEQDEKKEEQQHANKTHSENIL